MYPIFDIRPHAAESLEQLGTKYKFWYTDLNFGPSLFKEGRPGTGENWAEKIACELASLLQLPHAHYEFAKYGDRNGVLTPSLVSGGARLILGNELLLTFLTDYTTNQSKVYRQREHTLRRLLGYFRAGAETIGAPYGFRRTDRIATALDVFVGYLMFDAWIANQDRHDQNWALLRTSEGNTYLSPSFDHGSSLARNERDARRHTMLTTRDMGQHISKYVQGARSALYPQGADHDTKSLLTIEAFAQAARLAPAAVSEWRERLSILTNQQVSEVIEAVPDELMSRVAKDFTLELLRLNRLRILDCVIV